MVLNPGVKAPIGVVCQVSCVSDIYVMFHNGSKTSYEVATNNSMVGVTTM